MSLSRSSLQQFKACLGKFLVETNLLTSLMLILWAVLFTIDTNPGFSSGLAEPEVPELQPSLPFVPSDDDGNSTAKRT